MVGLSRVTFDLRSSDPSICWQSSSRMAWVNRECCRRVAFCNAAIDDHDWDAGGHGRGGGCGCCCRTGGGHRVDEGLKRVDWTRGRIGRTVRELRDWTSGFRSSGGRVFSGRRWKGGRMRCGRGRRAGRRLSRALGVWIGMEWGRL